MSSARLLDDLARFAGGTMSFASSVRSGIKDEVKARVEEIADRMDLVTRSEYEQLQMTLQKTLKKVEALEARLDLEKKTVPKSTKKTKAS